MTYLFRSSFTYLSFKALYSYQTLKLFILFRIVDPFMHYLFYAILASALVGSTYLKYVVIGNIVFYTCQTIIIYFMNMFRVERHYGTLELNIASPTNTITVIIKRALIPMIDGLFVFIIGLIIGNVVFGLSFHVSQSLNLLLIILVTLFSIICFSLLFACISLVFSNVNLFLNLFLSLLQILCGSLFSVSLLPGYLEAFSRLLPLTHSIEAIRTVYGLESFNVFSLLLKESCIGIMYLILALLSVNIMEKLARKNGALLKNL